MKLWQPATAFHVSSVVDGTFYIRQWEKGLLRMEGDSLRLVPGGERFANERVYVMLPFPDDGAVAGAGEISAGESEKTNPSVSNKILVGTRTQGLFVYDGHTFHPFKTEADDFLRQNALYMSGAVVKNRFFILNTLNGGVVFLDRNGRLLRIIDRDQGLQDNEVHGVYSDPARPEAQWQ